MKTSNVTGPTLVSDWLVSLSSVTRGSEMGSDTCPMGFCGVNRGVEGGRVEALSSNIAPYFRHGSCPLAKFLKKHANLSKKLVLRFELKKKKKDYLPYPKSLITPK